MAEMSNINYQLMAAVLLTVAGIVMLFTGMNSPPHGEIHSSLLVGFGEMMTFAGGLFGVDYCYRIKKGGNDEHPQL